jgi:mRNA interferase YafQ
MGSKSFGRRQNSCVRDVKLAQKRGKDMAKLREVHPAADPGESTTGPVQRSLARRRHHRDCHIEPDWLLIYKIDGDDLYLVRTGTHSDLF